MKGLLTYCYLSLSKSGWALIEPSKRVNLRTMMRIASELGEPVAHRPGGAVVSVLKPTSAENGHPNSLTSRYGQSAFPWHTDTAHWVIPARYVVLSCINPGAGRRPTFLLPWRELKFTEAEFGAMQTGIFLVRDRKHCFLTGLIDDSLGLARVDFDCMVPKGEMANYAKALVLAQFEHACKQTIEWQAGMIVVIDNWQVLHSRGISETADNDRQLLRVLVGAQEARF